MQGNIVEKDRLVFVDYFRAFGILLMIMGHVGFGSVFDKWIHAFHMPMWFFISGYFYKSDRKFFVHVRKRVVSLVVPFLFFSFCYLTLYYMRTSSFEINRMLFPNYTRLH